ncbi:MAG TPA: hypothetical protein VIG06_26235 [Kofleriaceae bacterium]
MTGALAVALGSAAGCSDDPASDKDGGGGASDDGGAGTDGDGGGIDGDGTFRCVEKSGTRLKKVVLDHGGDEADLVRFIDTDYADTECRFETAGDGSLRCLPVGTDTSVFTFASRYWTDAGCTSSIVELSYEGTPTSLAVYDGFSASTCSTPPVTRYYQAGSRLPYDGDETIYQKDYFTGACTATTSSFNRSYYTLGAEIPATTFVFGLEETSTGRLETRSINGEDGSRSCDVFSFRDQERDEACTLQVGEDGAQRCLPQIDFQNAFWTDAACAGSSTAATAQRSACAASNPRYIQAPPMICGKGRVLYRRKAVATGPFYYFNGTCTPLEAGYEVFPVGAHVPPEEFLELVEERRDVGGRLQRVDLVGGGARLHKDIWFDPELDSACWFRRTENGTWRCVPVSRPGAPVGNRGSMRNGFSDAACTAAVQAASENCFGEAPRYLVDSGDASRVYPVGEKLAQFYQSAGTCVPVEGNWHQVGAALPFDSLVSAYESTP